MKTLDQTRPQWLKVLGKGMVTIPKSWRQELGFDEGDMIMAQKNGLVITIEPVKIPAPYRIYSRQQLDQFIADDQLSQSEEKAIDQKIKKLK